MFFKSFIFRCLDTTQKVQECLDKCGIPVQLNTINSKNPDESHMIALVLSKEPAANLKTALEESGVPIALVEQFIVVSG